MSLPTEMKTQASNFVGVLKLGNYYLATHFKDNQPHFVLCQPETDLKVAQANARLFAEMNRISYGVNLYKLKDQVITVIKNDEKWFPAEINADNITLLTKFGQMDLSGTEDEAIGIAHAIALSRKVSCVPLFGKCFVGAGQHHGL